MIIIIKSEDKMEIRQLEYLVAAVESRSLNKAAERLYTSQPNVSKVLKNLEVELDQNILIRNSKGVQPTDFGEEIYLYAKNILKTVNIVEDLATHRAYSQLKITAYSSNMIARMLANYYNAYEEKGVHIDYKTGKSEDIIDDVWKMRSNIGILFYPEHQEHVFKQMLSRKKIVFHTMKKCQLCLYAGPKHPLYEEKIVDFEALQGLKFIQGEKDYFSLMEHVDIISQNQIRLNEMRHMVHTNSEHVMMNMLSHTDLCSLGLDFLKVDYQKNHIRRIKINCCNNCLNVGYILRSGYHLIKIEKDFLIRLKELYRT
jgi:DNA-binding transcriptional LysR family regulator